MIELKPGVRLLGLRTETHVALNVADAVYTKHGYPLLTVTSVTDSTHSGGSSHYTGCAVDLRSKNIKTPEEKKRIAQTIKAALGSDFDVLLEALGTDNEHLHIEFDPKIPY